MSANANERSSSSSLRGTDSIKTTSSKRISVTVSGTLHYSDVLVAAPHVVTRLQRKGLDFEHHHRPGSRAHPYLSGLEEIEQTIDFNWLQRGDSNSSI